MSSTGGFSKMLLLPVTKVIVYVELITKKLIINWSNPSRFRDLEDLLRFL